MGVSKTRIALFILSLFLVLVFVGGIVGYVVIQENESSKELVVTNSEEMEQYLSEEYVGKTVTYTGETVREIDIPLSIGQTVDTLWFDTSVDIKDFILGLDWDNPHIEGDLDYIPTKAIYLVTINGATIEDLIAYGKGEIDEVEGGALVVAFWQAKDGFEFYSLMVGGSSWVWIHDVNDNTEAEFEGWSPPRGDTGFPTFTGIEDCVITDIHPAYLEGNYLFMGLEEGYAGINNVVYESNTKYLVVANEANDGYHFEVIE